MKYLSWPAGCPVDDSTQMGALYHHIRRAGRNGATSAELAMLTGIPPTPQGPMLGCLVVEGCIARRGDYRLCDYYGKVRREEVWIAT